jgi:hypothetical protein
MIFRYLIRERDLSNRRAFVGDLNKCAVSMSPATSSAGIGTATFRPLLRTITTFLFVMVRLLPSSVTCSTLQSFGVRS